MTSRRCSLGIGAFKTFLVIVHIAIFNVANAYALESFPPFIAEALVTVKQFKPGDSEPLSTSEANVSFESSNGWWRVRAIVFSGPENGQTIDCMLIPDGVRVYRSRASNTNAALITGTALPLSFPPPGTSCLFPAWLALCPKPALPLIDAKRMRRFLKVGVADGLSKLLNDPKNIADYRIAFQGPEDAFVSMLSVTNTGFILTPDGFAGRYPDPFAEGFLSSEYRLLENTNIAGHILPKRGIYQEFYPRFAGDTRDDVTIVSATEITVGRIGFLLARTEKNNGITPALYARDYRPTELPGSSFVSYIVGKDQWRPTSDPQIKRLVGATIADSPPPSQDHRTISRVIVAITMLAPLLVLLFLFMRGKLKPLKKTGC